MTPTTRQRGDAAKRAAPAGQPGQPGSAIVQAKATRGALDELIESYADNFAAILPRHTSAEAFIGLAVAYIRRDEYLTTAVRANPHSLIIALREIAALGHVPQKGVAALVAYRSRKDGDNGFSIVAIEEVGGTKQRIMRAGGVTALVCDVVRENDRARFQRTSTPVPYHEYDEFASPEERGPLKAVYAYAILLSGQPSSVVWMPKATVMKHRAASRSGDAFWGPEWPDEGPWTEDMWKKTAMHKLADDLPSSAEYLWQMNASAAAAARSEPPPDKPRADPGDDPERRYIDAEFSEGAAPSTPDISPPTADDQWPEVAQPGGA
jgi:recombination protein RecT